MSSRTCGALRGERKKFWLIPLVGILLVLGGLVALAQISTVAPFIYALF